MPYIYKEVDALDTDPPPAAVGDGSCVALIKHFVPGLIGAPTASWREGGNVLELGGTKVTKGTAIATFVNGRYPNRAHGNHAAIVLKVMQGGIWVVDQWKAKAVISARLIRIPPPRQQRNQDGSFRNPSDNALAYFVIE